MGKRVVHCKWVYKVKHHSDGTKERLKARSVVRGDTQHEGKDLNETYSPIVKMIPIRCLLVVVFKKGWVLTQQCIFAWKLTGGSVYKVPSLYAYHLMSSSSKNLCMDYDKPLENGILMS